MECPRTTGQADEIVVAYVARTLDRESAAAFQKHLILCDACRALAAAQEAVWSTLDGWRPLAPSPGFDAGVLTRVAEDEHRRWWPRSPALQWSWRPTLSVAAACTVLVAAFVLKNLNPSQPPLAGPQTSPRIEQQVEHALDDMDLLRQLGGAGAVASPQS